MRKVRHKEKYSFFFFQEREGEKMLDRLSVKIENGPAPGLAHRFILVSLPSIMVVCLISGAIIEHILLLVMNLPALWVVVVVG